MYPTLTVLKLTQPHLANLLSLRGDRPDRVWAELDAMEELFPELHCSTSSFGRVMEFLCEEAYFRGLDGKSSGLRGINGRGDGQWSFHLHKTLELADRHMDFCYSRSDGEGILRVLRACQLDASFADRVASAYGTEELEEVEDCRRAMSLLWRLSEYMAESQGDVWALGVYDRDFL